MNLLGKFFVILVFIMSLGFMFLAMAVYATHTNWQEAVEDPNTGLRAKLTQAEADKARLTEQRDRLQSQLQSELDIMTQRLSQAETERDDRIKDNAVLEKDLEDARLKEREAIAAAEAAQQNNSKITDELTALRTEIRKEQEERDSFFTLAKQATEELQQTLGELGRAEELKQQLTTQVAAFTQRLRSLGYDPQQLADVVPRVDGKVLLTRRVSADQMIEISIGSDDGLKAGHTVEVYRGQRYLGRAKIVRTSPDKSVGKILPRSQNGPIQAGDRVAHKPRVG